MGQHRITRGMLDEACERINKALKCPLTYSSTVVLSEVNGIRQTNVGNFRIDCAYGGFALYQTADEMGGVRETFNCGHIPARDLYNRMIAFLDGIRAAREVTA